VKQIYVRNRAEWRSWLAENHEKEGNGVWLVFLKRQTGRPSIEYEESVEEALCFGWIDSLIKKIDDEKYSRKFSPRKSESRWSESNRKRTEKIIEEGRMTDFGLAKIEAAKSSGNWKGVPRPQINLEIPPDLSEALARNRKAKDFFDKLAPTYQKHFIAWIVTARRDETKAQRLKESMALLARGEKLGLK
jgi:uncharacterized protein YdeI (YjbR/CyaY-like superfamily)